MGRQEECLYQSAPELTFLLKQDVTFNFNR